MAILQHTATEKECTRKRTRHKGPYRPDYSVQPLDETVCLCNGLRKEVLVGPDTRVRILEHLLQRSH